MSPFIGHNQNSSFACDTGVFTNDQFLSLLLEVAMNAAADVSMHAIPETRINPLTSIALFCALVLGASLCVATFGLDMSAGFF
jgi:hypothetical protein